jgi:hypothetical protein
MLITMAPLASVMTAELPKSNGMSGRPPMSRLDRSPTKTSAASASQNRGSVLTGRPATVSGKGEPAPTGR